MDVPSGGLGVVRRFAGKNGVARLVGCVGGARVESSLRGKEEGRCVLCGYGDDRKERFDTPMYCVDKGEVGDVVFR